MSLLEVIQTQPNFPRVDLTDTNAEILSLALANSGIMLSRHIEAEKSNRIFKATHPSLKIAAEHMFDNPEALSAFEHGILALEAMTHLVQARRLEPEIDVLKINIVNFMKPNNTDVVRDYFQRVHAEFLEEVPNTASVIAESSSRYVGGQAHLAVAGGAAARQFGLDNAKD
jgi:hypothetical protein